jgi:hypothetical protein
LHVCTLRLSCPVLCCAVLCCAVLCCAVQGVEPVFSCQCEAGWRGVACESHVCDAIDSPSPCENGGHCIPVNASAPSASTASAAALGRADLVAMGGRVVSAGGGKSSSRAGAGGRGGGARRVLGAGGFICNCTAEWGGARCTNAPQPCNYPSLDDCEAVAWLLKGGCGQHAEYDTLHNTTPHNTLITQHTTLTTQHNTARNTTTRTFRATVVAC